MNYLLLNKLILLVFTGLLLLNSKVFCQELVKIDHAEEVVLAAGEQKTLNLLVDIQSGYHIQADKVRDENFIPTNLSFNRIDDVFIYQPIFPASEEIFLDGTTKPIDVFSNEITVVIPIKTHEFAKRGRYEIKGNLYFQACNSKRCLYPRNVDVTLKIFVR